MTNLTSPSEPGGGFEGRGPIFLASGKDTTGTMQAQLDKWNAEHPDEKVTLVELPESADEQRRLFIQNAQSQSDAYTVLNMDVIWTSEFAANQWIDELPADQFPLDQMIPAVVESGKYFNRLYAVPYNTNAGLLFYRKDLLDKAGAQPPKTWDEMASICEKVKALPEAAGIGCYAGQFDKYEGLTGQLLRGGGLRRRPGRRGGRQAQRQHRGAKKGLQFLVDGFASGLIPQEAITYKEEEGRRAFQDGKLVFHRQWPYQWVLANQTDGSSKVAGKFGVAAMPGLTGPGVSTLGGPTSRSASSPRTRRPRWTSSSGSATRRTPRQNMEANSLAPVYSELYEDSALQEKFPYLTALKESLSTARARPRVVYYGDTTAAIQENAYAALTKAKTVDQALADMQKQLEEVTSRK